MTTVEITAKKYYWVLIQGGYTASTPAYFAGNLHGDGSKNTLPWSVIGSDKHFGHEDITVLRECL